MTLDPDGRGTGFGFLAEGGKGKTTAGYGLAFAKNLVVEWKEGGKFKRSVLDLSPYADKLQSIQSMSFYYLGDGRWKTVAQDGFDLESNVIEP